MGSIIRSGGLSRVERIFACMIVCLYVASVMFFSYVEGMSVYTKLVAVLLVIFTGYFLIRTNRLPVIALPYKIIFAWVFYSLLGIFVAMSQDVLFAKWLTLLQVIFISLLVSSAIVQSRYFEAPWLVFLLASTLISIYTLLHKGSLSTADGRLYGTFGNSNMFGLVLLVSMLYGLYFISSQRRMIYKFLMLPSMVVVFYTLIQTGSRKAIVGLFLIGSGFVFFYIWNLGKRNLGAALLVLVVSISVLIAGIGYVANSDHAHRFERVINSALNNDRGSLGESEVGRISLLSKGIETALANPVVGVGLDNFKLIRNDGLHGNVGVYSHSNYVEVAVSTGLIGLVIYYAAMVTLLLRLGRRMKVSKTLEEKNFFGFNIFILLMCLIYDFAMVSYYEKVTWLVLAIIIASNYRIYPSWTGHPTARISRA